MEFPDLDASIAQAYPASDVAVLGIHPPSDPASLVDDFRQQTGVTFPLLPDVSHTLGQFTFPPGVQFPYPRDVVVDKNLTIRAIKNSFDADETRELIDQLLAE